MNAKIIAALIVLGVAGFWARSAFAKSANASTSGVERDSRLNASRVTGAAHESVPQKSETASAKVAGVRRVLIASSAFQQPFRLQPFAYADSQNAAAVAPIFVRDTPSSRLTVY